MPKVVLVGNPNAGKSTLFNQLTGLRQKVGNFPGVTVDKKSGLCSLSAGVVIEILDLPGTYSLYPRSPEEFVVQSTLLNTRHPDYPDLVLVVADAANLRRHLLLFTQIRDLGLPCLLVLNQIDIAKKNQLEIDLQKLKQQLGREAIGLSARSGENLEKLKALIGQQLNSSKDDLFLPPLVNPVFLGIEGLDLVQQHFQLPNAYQAWHFLHHYSTLDFLTRADADFLQKVRESKPFDSVALQSKEILARYEIIDDLLQTVLQQPVRSSRPSFEERVDAWLTHKIGGYAFFLVLLLLVFQAVFSWATYPMELIDGAFGGLGHFLQAQLPAGAFTNLLTEGIVAGLGGIVIFIPQIAILFFFIALLEESGYMARVVFIMDRVMRPFGLNGKSVVPLISGAACAVPAIMATRTIDNRKERLITLFITPLISCSARLPVYAILIALVIPDQAWGGIFNLQGLTLMAMYLLGLVAALATAWVLKWFLPSPERSFLIMELPAYKFPKWKNVGLVVFEKVKTFVMEAGKIILAISVLLWALASYGPPGAMKAAEERAQRESEIVSYGDEENRRAAYRLEASFAGHFGKWIEPAIAPLGYDWKIGIALLTSFAAREVFVGTISTIYSIGQDSEDFATIQERLRREKDPQTGQPRYTLAVGLSLLIYYAFAMQCMSTMAVVYRETRSWAWVGGQFLYMTLLAYLSALLVFQLLS
ncbi:MAG: ferrous iron transport protein B [Microscillaceae bacterium]